MGEAIPVPLPERRPRRLPPFGDERLARRAARGEVAAFEAIFARYHQELYRYCLAIVRDPDDAQDALQNTMSSALSALPGENREIKLRPWLYRVAHNHAISLVRARRGHDGEERLAGLPDLAAQRRPEDRERLRQLLADLETLPERQRAALTMRELSGLDFSEIADALGMSPAAARQALYEARLGLQRLEEGRAMECEQARELISRRDRRTLRSVGLRAHLRGCQSCRDFEAALATRRHDLAALCPPLPAVAAAGILQSLLGSSAGSGSAAAGAASAGITGGAHGVGGGVAAAGKGLGASLALKSAGVVAAGAIGLGAADLAGVVDLPGTPGTGGGEATSAGPASAPVKPARGDAAGVRVAHEANGTTARENNGGEGRSGADGGGKAADNGKAPAHSNAGGNSDSAPGPPAHSQAGGVSGSVPGPPAHSQAGGVSGSAPPPPAHSNAGGVSGAVPAPPESHSGGPGSSQGPSNSAGSLPPAVSGPSGQGQDEGREDGL